MNLESFPTNEMAKKMMDMITGNRFYDHSYVAKWLFQVMGMEMEDAQRLFEELREQIFPETATWGIIYHEQKFGIPPSDLIPLEERRRKVIQKRDIRAPMNPARLEIITTNYTGLPCTVTDPDKSYVFDIVIDFPEEMPISVIKGLYDIINRLKPSHLSYNTVAEMEKVVFKNLNIANLYSLLFAIEFYTDQSCDAHKVCFDIYHTYRTRIRNEMHSYFVLPENQQCGVLEFLEFMGSEENHNTFRMPEVSFSMHIRTENTITCKLLQDTMYTFDGAVLFDGSRRFNAKIIEEKV